MAAKYDMHAVLTMLLKSAKGDAKKAIQAELAKKKPAATADWLLRMAGEVGDAAAAQTLLDGGVTPDVVAEWPWLHLFKENVARLLLEAGINLNAKNGQWLCNAAYCGTPQMVQLLVDHQAELEVTGDGRQTPLLRAASEGRTAVVRILLAAGADVNHADKLGITPLMAAAESGKAELVALLVHAGADVQAERTDGTKITALEEIVREKGAGGPEATQALIAAGADVNHRGAWSAPRVLHLACGDHGDPAIVQLLIKHGADLQSDPLGFGTPLHAAVRSNRPDLVQVLLDAGADLAAVGLPQPGREDEEAGLTPLELARLVKARKVIPVLEAAAKGGKPPAKKAAKVPTVAASWQRIGAWIAEHVPEVKLRPGAKAAQFKAVEKLVSVKLPADFKALYQLHDGQEVGETFIPSADGPDIGYEWLPLDGVVRLWTMWQEMVAGGLLRTGRPDAGVRDDWWNVGWVPFADLGNGDLLCVDLAPAQGGTAGQIITMDHETGRHALLAPSMQHWLAQLADELTADV